ncbi:MULTISPECIES: hypothetical protein [unclassified Burkholderia]|uniref:hypothetical protein n=1 Tax=unclassified Burkholderia TaxID=2613784 RepID=UPI00075B42C9|nr:MULTISPECIES: hypothetical protein [unclassified Burkholderia]
MLVKMRVFDESQKETIRFQTAIDAPALIAIAKDREAFVREKGKAFAQGAVPFFGGEFIKAVQADDAREIEKNAMQAAMAAWLCDHIFSDVSEAEFVRCDLEFNLHPTGMVVYNRKPAQ